MPSACALRLAGGAACLGRGRPYGLGMYCQDLAETTNAKLKDFYLRFTNRGGSTTDDYQLSALLQTMEHAFMYYTHCPKWQWIPKIRK